MTIAKLIQKECRSIPGISWKLIKENFGFKVTKKDLSQIKNIDAVSRSYTGFESNGCIIYRQLSVLRARDNSGSCYINF